MAENVYTIKSNCNHKISTSVIISFILEDALCNFAVLISSIFFSYIEPTVSHTVILWVLLIQFSRSLATLFLTIAII